MKKKDKDAFLKSIFGTLPLKKKDRIKNEIPKNKPYVIKKNKLKTNSQETKNFKKLKSIYLYGKSEINKKLKKGKIPIDKKIDFHGLSVLDAEDLFLKTIASSYKKNLRCLLFVTGKGILKKNRDENEGIKLYYGKIRENFFSWIKKIEIQKYILSVEQAGIEHGSDGAFFVYLRKQKN